VVAISFRSDPAAADQLALERALEPRAGSRLEAFTGWAGQ
jgi:hypothetical protein